MSDSNTTNNSSLIQIHHQHLIGCIKTLQECCCLLRGWIHLICLHNLQGRCNLCLKHFPNDIWWCNYHKIISTMSGVSKNQTWTIDTKHDINSISGSSPTTFQQMGKAATTSKIMLPPSTKKHKYFHSQQESSTIWTMLPLPPGISKPKNIDTSSWDWQRPYGSTNFPKR